MHFNTRLVELNGPVQIGAVNMWKTGQAASYAAGDDGDLQHGVEWPAECCTDNGDGTVKDSLTGLIWLKNANCFGSRDLADALSDSNTLSDGSCGLTDGSSPGDWRLPNRKELISLIDFAFDNPEFEPFINVQSIPYYLSSTNNGWDAWAVSPLSGTVQYASNGPVWPVRDAPAVGHLTVNIEPSGAQDAGAQWCADGGEWQDSGSTRSGLSTGYHTVEFKKINGWKKPDNITVTIAEDQTAQETGTYKELSGSMNWLILLLEE
jgi:hypothetical protein